ncbi:MAG: glycoside hydrolase family 3 N-terminal domain-containing protein [Bacteroides sp.]
MKNNLIITTVCYIILCSSLCSCTEQIPVYKDASRPVEERVKDLLGRMTLSEKILQLNQYTLGWNNNENNIGDAVEQTPPEVGSLIYFGTSPDLRNLMQHKAVEETRLGIPILFGHDVIHGFRTVYQISLGQACSWNLPLVEKACRMAAREAKLSGVDWTFSPMIDVCHDPRWGRISECYGEDPYANGCFGAASVRGYQGERLSDSLSIAACLKHYVGYGASEAGRDYVYTEISRQSLWDTYLPPYRMCVEAGALTVMSAFNDISGTPASANAYTLDEVLKQRWGFKGFVVSDWDAVAQLTNQGMAADKQTAAALALNAGVDMDMMSRAYDTYLDSLLQAGAVSRERIDDAVSRILRVKFELGLFEHPYTPENEEHYRFLQTADKQTATELAAESMVLLKNRDNVLPLDVRRIAVIGPMARNAKGQLGNWAGYGREEDVELPADAICREFEGRAEVRTAEGCAIEGEERNGFDEACRLAEWADVVILCLGEHGGWSGENQSRASITLPAIQRALAARLKQCGKPLVVTLNSGRPLQLDDIEPLADALIAVWQPGVCGASALSGILSGRINPSGKLSVTIPADGGQIPIYYNRRKPARRGDQGIYKDMTSEPLYPFGYGLSYTTFSYSELQPSQLTLHRGETADITLHVTNEGEYDGKEAVLWFVSDPYSSITRPVKELKQFEKKLIRKGETAPFTFHLDPMRDLAHIDADGRSVLEDGLYIIEAGGQKMEINIK